MLLELDEAENASAAQCATDMREFNYMSTRPRTSKQQRFTNKNQKIHNNKQTRQGIQNKKLFCRICYHAVAPATTYQSHAISTCMYLSKVDRADFTSVMTQEMQPVTRKTNLSAPGWDVTNFSAPGWDVTVAVFCFFKNG